MVLKLMTFLVVMAKFLTLISDGSFNMVGIFTNIKIDGKTSIPLCGRKLKFQNYTNYTLKTPIGFAGSRLVWKSIVLFAGGISSNLVETIFGIKD